MANHCNLLSLPYELLLQIVECLQRQSIVSPWRPHSKLFHVSYGPRASCLFSVAHSCRRLRDVAFPLLHRRLELCHVGILVHSSYEVVLPGYVPLITYLHKYPDRGYVTRELKIGTWSSTSHWEQLRRYMSDKDIYNHIQTFKAVAKRCGVAYPVLLGGIESGDGGAFVALLTYMLPNLTELILNPGDEFRVGAPSTRHLIVAWKTVRPSCYQTLTAVTISYGDVRSHGEYPCSHTVAEFLKLPSLKKVVVSTQTHGSRGLEMPSAAWKQLAAENPDISTSFAGLERQATTDASMGSGLDGGAIAIAKTSSQFDEEIRLSYRDCSDECLLELSQRSAAALERLEFHGTWMGQWNILPIIRSAVHLKVLKLTDNSPTECWPDTVDTAIRLHAPSLERLILDVNYFSYVANTQEPSFLPCIAGIPHLKILWLNFRSILTFLKQPLDLQKFLPRSLSSLVIKDSVAPPVSWGGSTKLQAYSNAMQSLSTITREGFPSLEVIHVWKPRIEYWCYEELQSKLESLQETFDMRGIELLLM
ncbi:hypothetical protein Dda_6775 [Drechslerella dactyloides]|uniref:F-box domain-containing protein n=1 Tax=Drechslerella dactyloides TaxID=74499 RepID=A0AAD6IVH8_DREDA|nr:hypothetical protein Dda_6775 [Drechslerella dactyloides]